MVEKIRNSYTTKSNERSKIEELKSLDRKVKQPVLIFAYIYGVVGSLILGLGMCLAMKVIGNAMSVGIIIGLVGIAMVSTTYPIYLRLLANRKAKYSDIIIEKSNELLNK
ncbi:MAG: dihydropteridine reductase [Clostridia bacterium]|nr:dihydropteridine reductase [Clostridia bacterium]